MAAAVTGAHAATTIQFDTNGAAPGGVLNVSTFDWLPDNVLAKGSIGPNGIITNTPFTVFAQAKLGVFRLPGNMVATPSIGEFTLVASFQEQAFTGGASAILAPLPGGSVQIYFDPTANSNQLAGTGYNDGRLILQGSVASGNGAFTDLTRLLPGFFPNVPLDNFAGNSYPGLLTHQGNGSNTLNINVAFADPTFFLTNITSLNIDANDTGNLAVPFNQAEPAAQIGGQVPIRGTGNVNGGNCPTTCDFQFQTDNATSFNVAPEPGSVALLALGLLSLGGLTRKRVK
jgi:hypothetical protein